MPSADEHEIGRGLANLGAGHHELEMLGLNVLAALLQTVAHRHAQAGRMATQALFDAGSHFGERLLHIASP